jgi:ankyrin repeat protein
MLIRFAAPASIFDANGELVTSVEVHRQLDGTFYGDEAFTDFLGGPSDETDLALLLEHGGYLSFQFNESRNQLDAVTEFRAARRLDDSELELLTNYTAGQWSDGIGENFVSESFARYGFSLQPETEALEAEQIDDSVPSAGNSAAALFRAINADDLAALVAAIPVCADVNATLAGCTPLRWAIIYGHPDIAVELARHCDVSKRDVMSDSLLHSTTWSGMDDSAATRVATALINSGAEVNVKDDAGRTAAECAEMRGKPQLHAVLAQHGHPT